MPKWQVWILKKFGFKFGPLPRVDWGPIPRRHSPCANCGADCPYAELSREGQ